jgi:hypothetical protein
MTFNLRGFRVWCEVALPDTHHVHAIARLLQQLAGTAKHVLGSVEAMYSDERPSLGRDHRHSLAQAQVLAPAPLARAVSVTTPEDCEVKPARRCPCRNPSRYFARPYEAHKHFTHT